MLAARTPIRLWAPTLLFVVFAVAALFAANIEGSIGLGCADARNKGTCDNKATMRRDDLESAVLDGLQNRLMEPARTKIFCEEYARAMNRLYAEHNAQRTADTGALNKAER